MGTKLTLRMDEKLIKNAKKAASSRNVSLSRMVSDYFKSLSTQQKKEMTESPVLSEIAGILPSKADNKKLLKGYKKHIEDKYL
ncbi:MAG: antitoxin [Nitrospirae bacterium]|nr:antitoxin [Nitrospirota bacterium]